MSEIRSLSALLHDLREGLPSGDITVADILEGFHERGFGLILLIFALPMALPIPVPPGLNIALASPLLLLTAQQLYGRHTIWLPERVKRKTISAEMMAGLFRHAENGMKWAEWILRPRLAFVTRGIFSNLIGGAGLIMALTICIPVPLTNTVPSLGIACMALGVLMRDGLAVLAGMFIGLLWISLLYFLGEAGVRYLLAVSEINP